MQAQTIALFMCPRAKREPTRPVDLLHHFGIYPRFFIGQINIMKFPHRPIPMGPFVLVLSPGCIISDMTTPCRLLISILLVAATTTLAAEDSVPATSNVPGAQFPRVHDDLRVSFQLR